MVRVGVFFTGAGLGFATGLVGDDGVFCSEAESSPPPNKPNSEKVDLGGASDSPFASIAFLWFVSVMVGEDPYALAILGATLVGFSADRKYLDPVAVVTVLPFSILPPEIDVVSTKSPSSKFGDPVNQGKGQRQSVRLSANQLFQVHSPTYRIFVQKFLHHVSSSSL